MPFQSQIQGLRKCVAESETCGVSLRENIPRNGPFRREYDRHIRKKVVPVLKEEIERFTDARDDDIKSPACVLSNSSFNASSRPYQCMTSTLIGPDRLAGAAGVNSKGTIINRARVRRIQRSY